MDEQIRNDLLSLFPNDPTFVEDFLNKVDSTNAEAFERIARSVSTTATDDASESVENEVEEENVEAQEEETVETTEEEETVEEETVEANPIEVVLDETFVSDLVGSEEFRSHLREAIASEVAELKRSFEEKARSLEEAKERVEDTPARKQRATVSFRPRQVERNGDGVVAVSSPESFKEKAEDSILKIWGETNNE